MAEYDIIMKTNLKDMYIVVPAILDEDVFIADAANDEIDPPAESEFNFVNTTNDSVRNEIFQVVNELNSTQGAAARIILDWSAPVAWVLRKD